MLVLCLLNSVTVPSVFIFDSGRTLVYAEYGYPKGSPNTNNIFYKLRHGSVQLKDTQTKINTLLIQSYFLNYMLNILS
jgi:hypothetical protein